MAKYPLLPQAALELLSEEFKLFLATFEIDKEEWLRLKQHEAEKAEGIVAAFSDWVWLNVLQKTEYLEKREEYILYFFKIGQSTVQLLTIQPSENYDGKALNLLSDEDLLFELQFKRLTVKYTSKAFEKDAINEIYTLFINGCVLGKGDAFKAIALELEA